jgi:hypothetical protein
VTISTGLRYAAAAMRWQAPIIATVVSTTMVAFGGQATVLPLQVSSILLAAGAGFALDDPCFGMLAPSPTSIWRRRVSRMLVILPPVILVWSALVLWHGTSGPDETWTLVAVFAGLLGLALGTAGIADRRSGGQGGPVVAPTMLAALLVSSMVPPRWRPLPLGDVPGGWDAVQARWVAAAAIGALAFLASSIDPARRHSLKPAK